MSKDKSYDTSSFRLERHTIAAVSTLEIRYVSTKARNVPKVMEEETRDSDNAEKLNSENFVSDVRIGKQFHPVSLSSIN